jgi:hypothetical protein
MVRKPLIYFTALSPLALLIACSSSRFGSGVEVESVMSVQEQAQEAIEQTPLVFEVEVSSDVEAWERALYFFKSYSKDQVKVLGTSLKSIPSPDSRFVYEVVKSRGNVGFTYSVRCAEKSLEVTPDSTLNAKNLARFIKEGTYELSLVK